MVVAKEAVVEEVSMVKDHTPNKDQEEAEVKLELIKMLLTHTSQALKPQQLKNENILPS